MTLKQYLQSDARRRYLEACERQGIVPIDVSAKTLKACERWPKATFPAPRRETVDAAYRAWASTR